MLPSQHWARNFKVEADDIESLVNYLLEKETPLSTRQLAQFLVENRLNQETAALEERFKDARIYNPSHSYEIGQKLVFPAFDYQIAAVTDIRPGENQEYGDFNVISVTFEQDNTTRQFAADLTTAHKLSQENANGSSGLPGASNMSVDEILESYEEEIIDALDERLHQLDDLAYVTRKWFPRDLIIQVDDGYLNLAEAVLDISEGGPLPTEMILEQMGGLGDSPQSLQVFSLNYVLNQDNRFDEVGPAGEVLWYLTRMEPSEVRETPIPLRYTPIEYDNKLLLPSMRALEAEICDELSPIEPDANATEGRITLIYPHRRAGTLPLNARVHYIFPTAHRTARVWITLVDAHDGEEYTGWVVSKEQYVYGLAPLYQKYGLPIGAHITVRKADEPDKILIDLNAYRPRSEWVRLLSTREDQIQFENTKRAIGVDYDDLMILGIDDLAALDESVQTFSKQRKTLAAIMRMVIPGLGRLTPQGTVHAKTIYSAVNVLRRCPPGPILATLEANPDFENVGGDYWRLAAD